MSDLVNRVQARDPEAWDELYRRAYPGLHAYCRRRLATDHDADDAVAEVMARALAGIDGYRPGPAGIEGWLYGIGHNVVRERWRTTGRDGRNDHEGWTTLHAGDEGPLETVLRDEERVRVQAAFARLPAGDRDLLELRVNGGLDAEAVGALLGKAAGAVRMAQSRALHRLRTLMEEVS